MRNEALLKGREEGGERCCMWTDKWGSRGREGACNPIGGSDLLPNRCRWLDGQMRRLITAPTMGGGFNCSSEIMHRLVGANIIRLKTEAMDERANDDGTLAIKSVRHGPPRVSAPTGAEGQIGVYLGVCCDQKTCVM